MTVEYEQELVEFFRLMLLLKHRHWWQTKGFTFTISQRRNPQELTAEQGHRLLEQDVVEKCIRINRRV